MRGEPIQCPSTWPAAGELSILSSRVTATRSLLASLQRDDRPSDSLLAVAAQVDAEDPERPAFEVEAVEREKCDGCSRCKTVRARRGRAVQR